MAKNDDKKYWWIKLQTDFFYQNAIDFLMSQKNGSEYVVLYQMLCMKTANTQGRFLTEIGEVIVKYDVDKIQRDTKYFDHDTIIVALELYKRLGLIYEESDGNLKITDHENLVGYTTGMALRIAKYRKENDGYITGTNVPKSIELRVNSKDIKDNKDLNTIVGQSADHVAEVITYLNEKVGTKYSAKSKSNQRFINGRLNDGYTVDDLKRVIDIMCDEWLNTEMDKYLRPETLFNATKFQSYINRRTDKIYGDEVQPTNLVG